MTDKLETVGVQHLRAVDGQWHYGEAEYANQEERELVTRSQAEDIIAAERAERYRILYEAEESRIQQIRRAEKAEAVNAALTALVKEETARGDKVQARLTAMSKTIVRLREVLVLVTDNIEDEGDRAYFGSSNDADTIKEVVGDLDGWCWDDIVSDGELPDVYETSRNAIARAEALETQLAAAERARDLAVEWRDHDKDRAERYRQALERIAARSGIPMAGSFAAEVARAALEDRP